MTLSARQLLESKGFNVKKEIEPALEARWRGLEAAKAEIDSSYLAESKIGITHIPGGERVD